MGLVQILGRIGQAADQSTSDLIEQATQFSAGQNQMRKIRSEYKEEKRERSQHRLNLEDAQRMQEQALEVEDLKRKLRHAEQKNEVLRDLAADVILDRSSIRNTMAFLKNKWAPTKPEEFEKDFTDTRLAEKEKIEHNEDLQNQAYKRVDDVVASWSKPDSTRRRRPPAAKKKATPPPLK